ncbi:MAG: hypothetical protein J6D37_01220 [Clostridia bacterium]|nr:hypothetical protein [Clostridia bacterium]
MEKGSECTLKDMRFEYTINKKQSQKNKLHYFYLAEDKSLLYNKSGGDFSILLGGNWRFELMADSSTGKCVKYQSLLAKLRFQESVLCLPTSKRGEVFFKSNDELMYSSGCHYLPFEDKVYYDREKQIMCIGMKDRDGCAIEFTEGIIAVINNQQLLAIYLNLKGIPLQLQNWFQFI